jgi:anti-sigma regulatory factor (Ser/Thr protein kinase)
MTTPTTEPPRTSAPNSITIRGGEGAPSVARAHVRSQLNGEASAMRASDAVLIVSELVTNSVLHAHVGSHEALVLELTTLRDRLLIAVIDPGSQLEPQMLPANPAAPHGFGLRLVDEMSSAWGVIRDAAGTTRVWCELSLDRARPC